MSEKVNKGKVILAGAGPGDPELITLKTLKYLQEADVVLADRLVSPEILTCYVNPRAEIIYVGKQCRKKNSTPQSSINELLVQHGSTGKLVVRLKGGDVSIFSNILDELQTLIEAGIAYEIIPGVTAALGAAAYSGIPLTARNYSTAVRFLTYYKSDVVTEEYWKELANTNDTLVFYMSAETLDSVVEHLLDHNILSDKKLAVIAQATTPQQNVLTISLQDYLNRKNRNEYISPTIAIIGKVVALNEQFAWLKNSEETKEYFTTRQLAAKTVNVMLSSFKLKIVQDLISTSTKEELIWINGYLSGLLSQEPAAGTAPAAHTVPSVGKITVVYGTETGNSKKVATDFALKAKKNSINAKVVSLDQYRLNDLPKEEYLLAVISTQGEGEPPASAKKFYDHIHQNGFKLEKLKYGVLALGDTSYPLFCKAGEDVDTQLERLGGKRFVPIQKCDVDYESEVESWFSQVLNNLSAQNGSAATNGSTVLAPAVPKKSSGKKIYRGTILTNILLNDIGSNKETHHIEIGADDIEYLPGDSLGIIPENPERVVDPIIELLEIDRHKTFSFRNEDVTAHDLLKKKLNIFYLPERVVAKYATLVEQEIPSTKIGLLDLLRIYPLKNKEQFQELINILEPISPRLYSISSSPEAHGGEVHITVARDKFYLNEEWKCGLCSDFLSTLTVDSEVEFYIHKNLQFRLPSDDRDIIMIGPGTGIAPFRSFIAQRDAQGAGGKNWLFFGDQHFVSDFLYQTELQNWVETGVLTRLNVAFSRDQKEKVYVQHKMMKHGADLYNWLLSGASVYVCGAKDPMSADVEDTLMQIVQKFGNKTIEESIQFIELLKDESRYLKDVY